MSETGKPLSPLVGELIAKFPASGEINRKVDDAKATIARLIGKEHLFCFVPFGLNGIYIIFFGRFKKEGALFCKISKQMAPLFYLFQHLYKPGLIRYDYAFIFQ